MADSVAPAADTARAANDFLAAKLLIPATFEPLVADFRALVAAEIDKKGIAMRTAFKVVQKLKPDIIDRTVREAMPDFAHALEPCYAAYRNQNAQDLRRYFVVHEATVADAALTAADKRADKIYSRTIRSAYDRVRGRARREIMVAVPSIADTLARYA